MRRNPVVPMWFVAGVIALVVQSCTVGQAPTLVVSSTSVRVWTDSTRNVVCYLYLSGGGISCLQIEGGH
jgi:hypothetical protein